MSRSIGRVAILALLLAVPGCSRPEGPNLLLVTVDTLRADVLSCYGGPEDVGTVLCGLGDPGTRYVWAFSTAPYTVPSVASILTSRQPSRHRLSQFSSAPLADGVESVAEVVRRAGYRTGAVVSNALLERSRGLDRGFDLYDDRMPTPERNRPHMSDRIAEDATTAALDFIAGGEEPWFLWVHYQDPHGPYDPPTSSGPVTPSGERLRVLPDHSGWRGIPAYQAVPGLEDPADYRARYLDEVRYLDAQIGRLLDGAASPRGTSVILTADHGEALGEDDYWFAHGHSLGIDQIRVPLLFRPAGAEGGGLDATPVSLVDVAPTLLAEAGLAAPAGFVGRPLGTASETALAAAAGAGPGRPLFAEHHARLAVVADGRYLARDRFDLTRPRRDPNSLGILRPLPSRSALLSGDGVVPAYEPESPERDADQALLLDRHAARLSAQGAPPKEELDPETRERLRALGYLSE